ncbi:MAG: hypothetical protein N2486_06075 [Caloramator sp.]|nr:hypothetical protein [Caloramator sp.]
MFTVIFLLLIYYFSKIKVLDVRFSLWLIFFYFAYYAFLKFRGLESLFVFSVIFIVYLLIIISKLQRQIIRLVQEVGLLKERLEKED